MPKSHDSKNISRESENLKLAEKIITGQDVNFDAMFNLAKQLKRETTLVSKCMYDQYRERY